MPRLSIDPAGTGTSSSAFASRSSSSSSSSTHNAPPLKHLRGAADTEDLAPGDVVESWDYVFTWDADCVRASELEEWVSRWWEERGKGERS